MVSDLKDVSLARLWEDEPIVPRCAWTVVARQPLSSEVGKKYWLHAGAENDLPSFSMYRHFLCLPTLSIRWVPCQAPATLQFPSVGGAEWGGGEKTAHGKREREDAVCAFVPSVRACWVQEFSA